MKLILILMLLVSSSVFAAEKQGAITTEDIAVEAAVVAPDATLKVEAAEVAAPNTVAGNKIENTISATANKKETEIPVQLETEKKSAGNEHPVFKIILSLAIVGVLGCAGFLFIRRYRHSNVGKGSQKQIKVLQQHYLGPKKSLAIIRVAGESILIGITDQNISLIKELSLLDDEVPEVTPKNFNSVFSQKNAAMDFSDMANNAPRSNSDEANDEFSIAGIKDFVSSKMKNMRSL